MNCYPYHYIHYAVVMVEHMFFHRMVEFKFAWLHKLYHEVQPLYRLAHLEHHICKGTYATTPAAGIWEAWLEGGTLFFCNSLACIPYLLFHAAYSGPNVVTHTMWPHKSCIQWHTLHHLVHSDVYAINVPSKMDKQFSRDVKQYQERLQCSFFVRYADASDGVAEERFLAAVLPTDRPHHLFSSSLQRRPGPPQPRCFTAESSEAALLMMKATCNVMMLVVAVVVVVVVLVVVVATELTAILLSEAYYTSGLALDFYKSYNTSLQRGFIGHDPARFFSKVTELDTAAFAPCNSSEHEFTNDAQMRLYREWTGDEDGVRETGAGFMANCVDGYFWPSPVFMQWSTFFEMPTAIGIPKSEEQRRSLVENFRTLFHWWSPDAAFLHLDTSQVVFPRHKRREWEMGYPENSIVKLAAGQLAAMAPRVYQFLENLRLDLEDMQSLLLEVERGASSRVAACSWVRNNTEIWTTWIPVDTQCLPGNFSQSILDNEGETYLCKPCPAGTYENAFGKTVCVSCDVGTFTNEIPSWCDWDPLLAETLDHPISVILVAAERRIPSLACDTLTGLQALVHSSRLPGSGHGVDLVLPLEEAKELLQGRLKQYKTVAEVMDAEQVTQPGHTLVGAVAASQLLTLVQQLVVIRKLGIEWQEPLKEYLELLAVFGVDLDMLSLSCIASVSPVLKYVLAVSVTPILAAIALLLHLSALFFKKYVKQGLRVRLDLSALLRTVGSLIAILFISIFTSLVAPFQCNLHPNGRMTVQEYGSVFCTLENEHLQMSLIGAAACLMPLCFLSICFWIIFLKLPRWLRRADAVYFRACSFLWMRYRPGAERFSIFFLCRNALFVLCPLLPSLSIKLVVLNVLLYSSLIATLSQPWRVPASNALDVLLHVGLL
ncbi:unnamed protein product, partial [Symbiodinium sp. KB8]